MARKIIEAALLALERDLPELARDKNAFYRAFEERVEEIIAIELPDESEYVHQRLQAMVDATFPNGTTSQYRTLH